MSKSRFDLVRLNSEHSGYDIGNIRSSKTIEGLQRTLDQFPADFLRLFSQMCETVRLESCRRQKGKSKTQGDVYADWYFDSYVQKQMFAPWDEDLYKSVKRSEIFIVPS